MSEQQFLRTAGRPGRRCRLRRRIPPRVGFFTDTSVCIGCKACEVACKEWNAVPDDGFDLLGMSFDNTGALGANSWRHVAFIEQPGRESVELGMPGFERPGAATGAESRQDFRWLMSSDVCKHCTHAGCLDVCPTGALFRTEFGTVVVQQDICNGCGYCVSGCPYGVIERREGDGRAWKCTLCYDRLHDGLEPACAKACPTDSIQFGPLDELRERAAQRLSETCTRRASPRPGCTARTRTTGSAATARSSCCSTSRRCTGCRRTPSCRRGMPGDVALRGHGRLGPGRDRGVGVRRGSADGARADWRFRPPTSGPTTAGPSSSRRRGTG